MGEGRRAGQGKHGRLQPTTARCYRVPGAAPAGYYAGICAHHSSLCLAAALKSGPRVLPLADIAHFPGCPELRRFFTRPLDALVAAADGDAGAPDKLWPTCLRAKPCLTSAKPLPTASQSMLLAVHRAPASTAPPTRPTRPSRYIPVAAECVAAPSRCRPPKITSDDVPTRPTYEHQGACSRQLTTIALRRRCHRIVRLGSRFLLCDRQDAISSNKGSPYRARGCATGDRAEDAQPSQSSSRDVPGLPP